MKISEAITRIDSIKPNTFSQEIKVRWLSTIDGMIKKNIVDTHEGSKAIHFSGYDTSTPIDTELIVSAPYDDMYIKWLEAQMDYANGEYKKYNNSMEMFNTAYAAYERYYNRNNMPLGEKFKFF